MAWMFIAAIYFLSAAAVIYMIVVASEQEKD
jgi:hypothetical protein